MERKSERGNLPDPRERTYKERKRHFITLPRIFFFFYETQPTQVFVRGRFVHDRGVSLRVLASKASRRRSVIRDFLASFFPLFLFPGQRHVRTRHTVSHKNNSTEGASTSADEAATSPSPRNNPSAVHAYCIDHRTARGWWSCMADAKRGKKMGERVA